MSFERKQQLVNFYQMLLDDQQGLFSATDQQQLHDARLRFEQERFTIVVAGRFSAGKSLLINRAFLQADVLPYKNKPTTCHPVYIHYHPTKQVVLRGAEGQCDVFTGEDNVIKDALTNHVAHYGNDPDRYQVVELGWPDAELLQHGIILVDTIGTEDTEERYIQQTYREMERATVVMFLTNVQQAGTDSEKQLLEKYLQATGKKLFFVVTQADVRSPEEQQEVLADFRQRFHTFFAQHGVRVEERIFLTSAKTGQGLPELRQCLVDFVARSRFQELLTQHGKHLQTLLAANQGQLTARLQDYQAKKSGDEIQLREAAQKLKLLDEELNQHADQFEIVKDEVANNTTIQLNDALKRIRDKTQNKLRLASNTYELAQIIQDFVTDLNETTEPIMSSLPSQIAQAIGERLRKRCELPDTELWNLRMKQFNSTGWKAARYTAGLGSVSGLALAGYGAWTSLTALMTATTTAANTGILASAWTALAGGAAVTSTTAALTVGLPFVVSGAALTLLGFGLKTAFAKKELEQLRAEQQKETARIFGEFKQNLRQQIKTYVNEQVELQLTTIRQETTKQRTHLEQTMRQIDMQTLQRQIDTTQQQCQWFHQTLAQLKAICQV
jgi:predicted GTPase